MLKPKQDTINLEILVSTMNRTSLDFLKKMFIHDDFLNYNILIINQTTKDRILKSDFENVRVINSFERGLSKSRNLAIKNAKEAIGLIADDDLEYCKGFKEDVLEAFKKNDKAALITFKAKKTDGTDYRVYSKKPLIHDKKSIYGVISWEIAVNISKVKELNVRFNENFGLGSQFPTSEEYIFTYDVLMKTPYVNFENKCIVSHDEYNSGMDLSNDKIVYARSALAYKFYGAFAYVFVFKYVFFLLRKRKIHIREVLDKIKIAFKGISDYKKVLLN